MKTVKYDNIKAFLDKLESEGKEEMKSVFNTLHITRKKLTDHGSGVLLDFVIMLLRKQLKIPCSKLQGIFDRKEFGHF